VPPTHRSDHGDDTDAEPVETLSPRSEGAADGEDGDTEEFEDVAQGRDQVQVSGISVRCQVSGTEVNLKPNLTPCPPAPSLRSGRLGRLLGRRDGSEKFR
jgi:hypothetical protein